MGLVTIFEKENCVYCKKVHAVLEKVRAEVLQEAREKGVKGEGGKEPSLEIKMIDCGKEPAYAAFCVRTTGTFTVPHVFFNESYIGDATKFLGLDCQCKAGYNVLKNKLTNLALKSCPKAFPPPPEASMFKVTDTMAFSGQPTMKQLVGLKQFGIKSLINILRPDSPAYYKDEQQVVLESGGVTYLELPLYVVTKANVWTILERLMQVPGPVLVHDDIGLRAGLVVLLSAAQQMIKHGMATSIPLSQILEWGDGLSLDLRPFKATIHQILEVLNSNNNNNNSDENKEKPQETNTGKTTTADATEIPTF